MPGGTASRATAGGFRLAGILRDANLATAHRYLLPREWYLITPKHQNLVFSAAVNGSDGEVNNRIGLVARICQATEKAQSLGKSV